MPVPINSAFTQRLIEMGVIPKECIEWQLKGRADGAWEITATVFADAETLEKIADAIAEDKPEVVRRIAFANYYEGSVGPVEI